MIETSEGTPAHRTGERRRRGTLSVDEISETALRLIDTSGLEALSMRTLARELGVKAMTLYYYVPTKADLLDVVCRRALGPLNVEVAPDTPWDAQLEQALTTMHAVLIEHPGTLELFLAPHLDGGPVFDDLRETLLGVLRRAGFETVQAVDALTALISFVLGFASLQISRDRRGSRARERSRLRKLSSKRFPYLVDAADVWGTRTSDEAFDYGLKHILDGVRGRRG